VSIELIAFYFHSFEILRFGEIAFCKPEFIIIKSNYFQNSPKGEAFYFFDDFEALVLENHRKSIHSL
jgi:hypothetical protein